MTLANARPVPLAARAVPLAAAALAAVALVALASASPAAAQAFSNCQAIARTLPAARVIPVSMAPTPVNAEYEVEISYVGHATFRIVAPDGTTIATDYTGYAGTGVVPDIVTMNIAHSSHYTRFPDPAIAHVLRGWGEDAGEEAEHFLTVGEVLVRNVTTDIRSYGSAREGQNSIFIFEIAGLCIGHVGHLHQTLNDSQVAQIGRLDIVFVPIDGTFTMDQKAMMEVVSRLRSSVVIPMHWWSTFSLQNFAERTRADGIAVETRESPTVRYSLNTLPEQRTFVILPKEQNF